MNGIGPKPNENPTFPGELTGRKRARKLTMNKMIAAALRTFFELSRPYARSALQMAIIAVEASNKGLRPRR